MEGWGARGVLNGTMMCFEGNWGWSLFLSSDAMTYDTMDEQATLSLRLGR